MQFVSPNVCLTSKSCPIFFIDVHPIEPTLPEVVCGLPLPWRCTFVRSKEAAHTSLQKPSALEIGLKWVNYPAKTLWITVHSYHTANEGFNAFKRCPPCYPGDPCSGKNGQSYWPGTWEGRLPPCSSLPVQYYSTVGLESVAMWNVFTDVQRIKIQQAYIRSQITVEQPRMGESRFGPFSTRGTKLQGFWITKKQLVEKQ